MNRKDYFEGWYFKNVSADLNSAVAIIPGVSLSRDDPHAFVQFIDGINRKTTYFRYNTGEFHFSKKEFRIRVGNSEFSEMGISLNLKNEEYDITGALDYSGHIKLPRSLMAPGIMGWYSYIPTMECNHGVVSMNHNIEGTLTVNGAASDFTRGSGYIEKDWGISFPESWIWLQCNNFSAPDTSLMISVAKIPWRGHFFIGLISFLTIGGYTEIFATYNRSKIISLKQLNKNSTEIIIQKGNKILNVRIAKSGSASIIAPVQGSMSKIIKESINSEAEFSYDDGSGNIHSDKGKRAGYEEIEKIFTYF
jgi:tocopherol cyclase